jgi:hypothetical protein
VGGGGGGGGWRRALEKRAQCHGLLSHRQRLTIENRKNESHSPALAVHGSSHDNKVTIMVDMREFAAMDEVKFD